MDIERFNIHSIDACSRVKPVMCQLKVHDWFLRIALSTKSVWMCGFECVPAPGFLIENFILHPKLPFMVQSAMMGQSNFFNWRTKPCLAHVKPKWSNGSSKVCHLVFSLDQWYVIVAYQIPYSKLFPRWEYFANAL